MNKKPILIFSLIIIIIAGLWFAFTQLDIFVSEEVKVEMKPITLNYWRVYDGPDAFSEIIANYNAVHPYITINYKKLRYDEYEQELLEAFATDRGPDIFSIHNTWMGKYKSKKLITPLPPKITMAYPVVKGTIKKEIVSEVRTVKSLNSRDIDNKFIDVVYDDVVYTTKKKNSPSIIEIYGLPLFVDTLAMYYNKDLFNNAGITEPSRYWNRKFQQDVKKLTKQDSKGNIIQSGIALGGSDNIERFSDILSILMMQNKTEMMNEGGVVSFNAIPKAIEDKNYNPGIEAVRFYTDFANPGKEVYSWNDKLDNSLNFFADGKLGMFLGYSYQLPIIKARNPKLNFNITKLPQIEGQQSDINFANYWIEVVSNKSKNKNAAWNFVQFITSEDQAKIYLKETKKPTALRKLINDQIENFDIGVFAKQVLTAKSWYKGNNELKAEKYIGEMVERINSGEGMEETIGLTVKKVQQTVNEK